MRASVAASVDRLVLAAAGRLGASVGDAVVRAADALAARAPGRRAGARAAPRFALAAAKAALAAGDLPLARRRTDALERAYPGSPRVLELRERVLAARGEIAERVRMLHRLHLLQPTDERLAAERAAIGEVVVTSPGWLPRIQGPPCPIAPAGDEAVLRLLRVPGPGPASGLAVRTDGADRRLDLGPFYPVDRPLDERLADLAWLAASVGRSTRPAVIHVRSDRPDPGVLKVGLALRTHLGRPLVVAISSLDDMPADDSPEPLTGERRGRRTQATVDAIRGADHVTVPTEPLRATLLERGVAPERVTVVPDGSDADARLRAVHAEVLAGWTPPDRGTA